jgi:hypothetical protein
MFNTWASNHALFVSAQDELMMCAPILHLYWSMINYL